MAQYKTDMTDVFFNLFDVLKVQEHQSELGVDDLKDIVRQLDNFVEKEIFPHRISSDEHGAKIEGGQVRAPEGIHSSNKQFYENGWMGLGLSEDKGGMPVPHGVYALCHSLWSGANVAWSMYPGLSRAAMNVIMNVGTEKQGQLFATPILEGRWGGTMCLTEAGAGSDVGALRSTATPLGDGKYKIKGTKIFISSGESDLYENNIHLVLARTPEGKPGSAGISLFIVPRFKVNDDGSLGESNDVVCPKIEEKMGLHAQGTSVLTFGDNDNCEGFLIGNEFEGMKNMFIMMNEARLSCGIQGESQANLAYQLTKQYTLERSQFGKEIINHPDIRRMMLKMRAMCRGMRSLMLYTADLFDRDALDEVALLTPVVKSYCTDEAFQVAVDAIQVHGGYGYCTEYGIEQFARDIKIASIYEGTNGIQGIDFVLRKILKDQGKTFMALGAKIQKSLMAKEAAEWEKEISLFATNAQKAQLILEAFGKNAQANNFDAILQHTTDFQQFCGNLFVGWRLLENAKVAKNYLTEGKGNVDEKSYYETAIVDFKIFCQHYLTENIQLSKRILDFGNNVMEFSL